MTHLEFINKYLQNHKYEIKDGNLIVNGNLDISNTNITKLPDNLIVNGWLDIRYTKITELPDNLIVNGDLDIGNTKITELPNDLVVNGSLDIRYTNITKLPDNLIVNGNLDIRYTNITKLPDNLIVNGWLDIGNTKITKLPDNLIVYGNLWINNTNITKLPDNLIVYGSLWINNTKKIDNMEEFKYNLSKRPIGKDGKYRIIDGILCEVLKDKGSILKVKIDNKIAYVIDTGYCYSHGTTVKEARENLKYKLQDRDTSKYSKWNLNTRISEVEAIQSYRCITGACEFGVRHFCNGIEIPKVLTPKVVIKLTKNQYGNEKYSSFFKK